MFWTIIWLSIFGLGIAILEWEIEQIIIFFRTPISDE